MMVDALQGMTAWTEPGKEMVDRDKTTVAKGQFSTMLRQLETGGGITDTGENNGEDTTTVIQVMSDGSVLITVYEGDKLISQTKTHAAHPEETPTILSTQVEKSVSDKAGEELTASEQAAQMLNMLLQK